jgi:hypothetical protein
MRKALAISSLFMVAACADSRPTLTEPEVNVEIIETTDAQLTAMAMDAAGVSENDLQSNFIEAWLPILRGAEEVPPRDTRARGASLLVAFRGSGRLAFALSVSRIRNVVQAHIHVGPRGTNGPVVAFLFGPVPPNGGRRNGVIAVGELTDASLIGPLAGKTINDLLTEIRNGNAYVNVHTDDGVLPPNTGPGDFPGGEIRGQIAQ